MTAGRPKKVEPTVQEPTPVAPTIQEIPVNQVPTIRKAIPVTSIQAPINSSGTAWIKVKATGKIMEMSREQALRWCRKYTKDYEFLF